jgi:hypothetical protein
MERRNIKRPSVQRRSAVDREHLFYAVISDSSAMRLGITKVEPFCWIRCCFLKPANRRLTVSREVPIICPISSCVRASFIWQGVPLTQYQPEPCHFRKPAHKAVTRARRRDLGLCQHRRVVDLSPLSNICGKFLLARSSTPLPTERVFQTVERRIATFLLDASKLSFHFALPASRFCPASLECQI